MVNHFCTAFADAFFLECLTRLENAHTGTGAVSGKGKTLKHWRKIAVLTDNDKKE